MPSEQSITYQSGNSPLTTQSIFLEKAQARGLDPKFVLGRLVNSSFVSRHHRYIYVETPKAACTKLKHFISEIENAPLDLNQRLYLRETRTSMLIHQRLYVGVPALLNLTPQEVREILPGKTDYLIFALIRNPFSRLVSTFESKVRLHEPGFWEAGKRWGAIEAGDDIRAVFSSFVREAVPYFARDFGEHHFIPQCELLLPDFITYTRFFPVERFAEFEQALFSHLRARGVTRPLEFREHGNRALYPNWRYYYDEPTARMVADFYKKDFELFGYDPESWRSEGPIPELRTSPEESYWRKAVVERNEMICFLYERLK